MSVCFMPVNSYYETYYFFSDIGVIVCAMISIISDFNFMNHQTVFM